MDRVVTIAGPGRQADFGQHLPLALIAGPCQIETRDHSLRCAEALARMADRAGLGLVFKSSFDKANRSSGAAQRGPGLEQGLRILADVRTHTGLPVITDVHEAAQCAPVAEVADALQIPAFLCRQTDLLVAAARTGKPLNVKKGQFLAPWDMAQVAAKIEKAGGRQLLLCERGTSFGYNTLVSDFRALPVMAGFGWPVVFDATHSVQQPGGLGDRSGGQRHFVPVLARAAVAVGVAGLFVEVHETPDLAPSDGPNMLALDSLPALLDRLVRLDQIAKAL